jgi:ABC-type sugar transport system substrate-binding protein
MRKVSVTIALLALALSISAGIAGAQEAGKANLRIGVMPKLIGIDFFNATEVGARKAGEELGVTVDFDGPVTSDVTLQAQMLETWIAKKYDAIAIAPNDKSAIAPVLAKARKRRAECEVHHRNGHPDRGQPEPLDGGDGEVPQSEISKHGQPVRNAKGAG